MTKKIVFVLKKTIESSYSKKDPLYTHISTASVCPVVPEQTSSYEGLSLEPCVYPTYVLFTPGTR